ncbi:MAG: LCP family protein, partial [Eubacteriales bacterium]|nr:LCP family protein [Eubacteriales bacterium]
MRENKDNMFDDLDLGAEQVNTPAPEPEVNPYDFDPLKEMEEGHIVSSPSPKASPRASRRTGASAHAATARHAASGEATIAAAPRTSSASSHTSASPAEPKKKTIEVGTTEGVRNRKAGRHEAEPKKKKKGSKIKKIILLTLLELITLGAIFAYGYFLRAWNSVTRPEVNEKNIENTNISAEKLAEMEQGYFSFAVFGVDGRNASDLVSRGLNSDVIMIVNINKDTGDIKLCSVYRDTYLNISDKNKYNKINQAYSQGGPEQALAALNKNLDLNLKYYVTFNWKAVVDGINILGGVDNIDISKAELYYINAFITETVNVTKVGSTQLTKTGPQHLDGVQAVAYGRLRLMDSDYSRVERQKKVLAACFEKAKKANFSVLNNIIVVCFPQVATNINFNEVVYLAQNVSRYNIADSGGFPWQRSESIVAERGDCIVPATLESNVKRLHAFLFGDEDYQPSQAVMTYSETIKEKTHVYREGQVIESVRTDGGLVPRPTTAASAEGGSGSGTSSTTGESESETKKPKKTRVKLSAGPDGVYVFPTDEDGNVIYETDADGNILFFENEDGEIIYPTDADGNSVRPTDADGNEIEETTTRPNEVIEGNTRPGETVEGESESPQLGPGGATGPGGLVGPGGQIPTTSASESSSESSSSTRETTAAHRENETVAGGANGPGGSGNEMGPQPHGPGGSSGTTGGGQTAPGQTTPGSTGGPGSSSSTGSGSSGGPGSTGTGSGTGSAGGPGSGSTGTGTGGTGSTTGPGS